MNLARNLKKTPYCEVIRAANYTASLKLANEKEDPMISPALGNLECIMNLQERIDKGEKLLIIDDLVYDVLDYMDKHPGGKSLLKAYVGRDASYAFKGGLNKHSISAKLLAQTMIVGRCPR